MSVHVPTLVQNQRWYAPCVSEREHPNTNTNTCAFDPFDTLTHLSSSRVERFADLLTAFTIYLVKAKIAAGVVVVAVVVGG